MPKATTGDVVSTEDEAVPSVGVTAALAEDSPAREQGVNTFELHNVNVHYGDMLAVKDVSLDIPHNRITAFIGPSGCGKSTILRSLNRMNDLIPGARVSGEVLYYGVNMYGPKIDPVQVRTVIGMVFQKPNPFPKSIYDNVAFGPRILKMKGDLDDIVESSLRRAALHGHISILNV